MGARDSQRNAEEPAPERAALGVEASEMAMGYDQDFLQRVLGVGFPHPASQKTAPNEIAVILVNGPNVQDRIGFAIGDGGKKSLHEP
jgi:hypothetical protein